MSVPWLSAGYLGIVRLARMLRPIAATAPPGLMKQSNLRPAPLAGFVTHPLGAFHR